MNHFLSFVSPPLKPNRKSQIRIATLIIALSLAAGLRSVAAEKSDSATAPDAAAKAHTTYLQVLRESKRFPTAATCAQCHPDHYSEWSVSAHAYAMLDPVFSSLHTLLADRTSGSNGDFCIRCHSEVGMYREEKLLGSSLLRSPIMIEGVSCVACHRVDRDFGKANGRISMTMGSVTEPVYGTGGNTNLKAAIDRKDFGLVTDPGEIGKQVHKDAIRFPFLGTSAACATCHELVSPGGLRVDNTFTEYKNSPASAQGTTCQDCHMSQTPGWAMPAEKRLAADGRDLNFAFGPAAKVRNSPRDPKAGLPTPPRKRTSHMFVGPDYSIVHPGIYPHSLEAREFTFANRFRKTVTDQNSSAPANAKVGTAAEQNTAREAALINAGEDARRHALSDWISFRWWEGWGTPAFEKKLSADERQRRLAGVGFPWADPQDETGSRQRREAGRVILSRQFNLLNRAHVERTRLLRRAIQLKEFQIARDDDSGLRFSVDVHNVMNGHSVPSGVDADREMFLEVTVLDAQGRVLFRSGDRDPNGDIRDLHSSYVHAHAPKTDAWLEASAWRTKAGLPLRSEDRRWELDSQLFLLQSRFITHNLVSGEREQELPLNFSHDPLPFIRPSGKAEIHTGGAGAVRKQNRTLPPLGHRVAEYRVEKDQLTGARPYRIELRFIVQAMTANFVKAMSPVGFDYNLSAREVATRLVYGHQVNDSPEPTQRRGGAVTVWRQSIPVTDASRRLDLTPTPAEVLDVPESEYPFPHTTEAEIHARETKVGTGAEARQFLLKHLGPLMPELWPNGVPEGLPFLPPKDAKATSSPKATEGKP